MTANNTIVSFHVTPNINHLEIVKIHAGMAHNVYVVAPHVSTNCNTCSDIYVTYMFYEKSNAHNYSPCPYTFDLDISIRKVRNRTVAYLHDERNPASELDKTKYLYLITGDLVP
jgi:hypothetical protein